MKEFFTNADANEEMMNKLKLYMTKLVSVQRKFKSYLETRALQKQLIF